MDVVVTVDVVGTPSGLSHWRSLAGYAVTTGITILVVIPVHSVPRAAFGGAVARMVGTVQLVGGHAVADLHGRAGTETSAYLEGALDDDETDG